MIGVYVELTKGYFALVDAEDVERVTRFRWVSQVASNKHVYGRRRPNGHIKRPYGPSSPHQYLHRFIVDAPKGAVVDHINGDTLDNRKSNLRVCSYSENSANQRRSVDNTSGFKGVSWDRYGSKWRASLGVRRRVIYIGLFDSPEAAARAYDQAALEHFGEHAHLNFPKTA